MNFSHSLTPLKQKIKFDCIYEKTFTDGSNKFIGGHVHLVNQKEILASELNSLRVHQLFGRCYGIPVFTSKVQLFAGHNTHTCYHDHKNNGDYDYAIIIDGVCTRIMRSLRNKDGNSDENITNQ